MCMCVRVRPAWRALALYWISSCHRPFTRPDKMCILLLHYHPSFQSTSASSSARSTGVGQCTCPYTLVAAVNRDELYERPTRSLHFWKDQPGILAGRDLMRGERGTWMGVSRQGRLAVLTNYRCPISQIRPDAVTRGRKISTVLTS